MATATPSRAMSSESRDTPAIKEGDTSELLSARINMHTHLRRWQPKLRNKMTKAAREQIKSTAKAVVKKGKKKDGTTSVSDT